MRIFNPSQKSPGVGSTLLTIPSNHPERSRGISPKDECTLFFAREGASTFRARVSTLLFLFFFIWFVIGGCVTSQENYLKDNFSWDFGQVKEGRILEHTFILRNNSDKLLIVKRLDTFCGCTSSSISNKKILPGETAQIKVSFNTAGYKGRTQQYIYVYTDRLENPIIKFTASAEVIKK